MHFKNITHIIFSILVIIYSSAAIEHSFGVFISGFSSYQFGLDFTVNNIYSRIYTGFDYQNTKQSYQNPTGLFITYQNVIDISPAIDIGYNFSIIKDFNIIPSIGASISYEWQKHYTNRDDAAVERYVYFNGYNLSLTFHKYIGKWFIGCTSKVIEGYYEFSKSSNGYDNSKDDDYKLQFKLNPLLILGYRF